MSVLSCLSLDASQLLYFSSNLRCSSSCESGQFFNSLQSLRTGHPQPCCRQRPPESLKNCPCQMTFKQKTHISQAASFTWLALRCSSSFLLWRLVGVRMAVSSVPKHRQRLQASRFGSVSTLGKDLPNVFSTWIPSSFGKASYEHPRDQNRTLDLITAI